MIELILNDRNCGIEKSSKGVHLVWIILRGMISHCFRSTDWLALNYFGKLSDYWLFKSSILFKSKAMVVYLLAYCLPIFPSFLLAQKNGFKTVETLVIYPFT